MTYKGTVVVYSITGCPHCQKAKHTLTEKQIPFTDINLENFPQCGEDAVKHSGRRTVPQIFFNAIHIGGNDDLQELVEEYLQRN